MSRYYDDDGDYERGRGRRPSPPPQFRDRSPDYHYAGGASQARLQYEPQSPFYPPDGGNNLQVPQTRHRPRSLPPMSSGAIVPRGRRARSPASSVSSEERERDRSPLAKARHVLKDTFSQSNSGLGVGVLGAIVGGIAAREASEATIRARGKSSHSGDHDKSRLVSTIIGAAVGGLGANALEKRLETAKRKDEETREEVDRRPHGPVRGANADYYDNDDYDYVYDRKPRHRRSEDRY